ncbi:ferritin-like domain-containing protein [Acaryochloris marina]|uniref:Iminophenyl-pyruvate dimer synthase domain-containing protein n=1 Tax=Acaryochloris marina (strain MBIC 11017) TaxID=329726 RepID=B0C5X5_ACAM1|nr:ferritin-like protein [Acaryochloris marina]ABW29987.1 conserved hypothetical protein [Acaryochloris marina MBIC11017]
MLYLEPKYIDAVKNVSQAADLYSLLQNAIQLEHSTIPPYLTAAYSLKPANSEIRRIIANIAAEEMLHMAIVANILNAIGGSPQISIPEFIPKYPTTLPMGIIGGLEVGLERFSKDLVKNKFMEIEQPENPIFEENDSTSTGASSSDLVTIGDFYREIINKISELGDDIFTGDPELQVVMGAGFPISQLFPITNSDTAIRSLEWIIKEGEGTTRLPFDDEDEPAHYYQFEAIFEGRQLDPDAEEEEEGYPYTGREIRFDPSEVWDFPSNQKAANYPDGSEERRRVDQFNLAYSNILRVLQEAFNGKPEEIGESVFLMGGLRRFARDVVSRTDPRTNMKCGLTFEFIEE